MFIAIWLIVNFKQRSSHILRQMFLIKLKTQLFTSSIMNRLVCRYFWQCDLDFRLPKYENNRIVFFFIKVKITVTLKHKSIFFNIIKNWMISYLGYQVCVKDDMLKEWDDGRFISIEDEILVNSTRVPKLREVEGYLECITLVT